MPLERTNRIFYRLAAPVPISIVKVIITRTPLRISIGGGGTDLPSYYRRFGGFVISAAINKHIYVGINETFSGGYFLKYSALERVIGLDDIRHPLIREALRMHSVPPPIEVVSMADVPAGTGLGSSGAFTVGLLRAVHAFQRKYVDPAIVAEEACKIEIEILQEPVGKQDQYIAAFGGLACFEFAEDGCVSVAPLQISNETLYNLEDRLMMFFTGYSRNASAVLGDQKSRSEVGDNAMLENLHYTKQLGQCIKLALEQGNPRRFGELMHQHWMHKKERSPGTTNECINHWYEIGRKNGAVGGKLVGAGGGGFLLFYADDRDRLRRAMCQEGLQEFRFKFDHEGSKLLSRD
jgi:D-glycero-alpha-D-manno-heptose-7-phosphate kinase